MRKRVKFWVREIFTRNGGKNDSIEKSDSTNVNFVVPTINNREIRVIRLLNVESTYDNRKMTSFTIITLEM